MFRPQAESIPIPVSAAIGPASRREAADTGRIALAVAFGLLSASFFYAAISRAAADYFWMDEVLAISAADQRSLLRVWHAIWAGTDFSPPTYHFFLHGLVRAAGGADGRFIWRLPSILAIYGAAVTTYVLLLRAQLNKFVALLGFGIVLSYVLFYFAIQARPYGLLTFGLALSLLLWWDIDDTRVGKIKAGGLWLVLAICLSLHFYAIVNVAVIGVAELIYAVSRRRLRLQVWAALLFAAPVEFALWPLASHLAKFNAADNAAAGYYAKPTLEKFYDAVMAVVGGGQLGRALLITTAFAYFLERFSRGSSFGRWLGLTSRDGAPAIETRGGPSRLEIVIIALAAIPVMTFALSLLVTGSFNGRYMIGAALLPAIAIPYVLDRLSLGRAIALAAVPIICCVVVLRAHEPDPIADVLSVLQKPRSAVPVVVGEGRLYIELMEAADGVTRRQLVFLKSPEGTSSPDPTNENEVKRLATFHPDYRVSGQDEFLKANSRFYLLSRTKTSTDTTTPALAAKDMLADPLYAEKDIELQPSLALARAAREGSDR